MFTTSKGTLEEEPLSDAEYETPDEDGVPALITKYEKMASFKEAHQLATPRLKQQDNALLDLPELTLLPLRLHN